MKPKDVVCDICGNRYRREAGLRQHMASAHTQFREFKCSICFKGFTTKARLTQHHRIHTGHKPFKCAKCDYRSKIYRFTEKIVLCINFTGTIEVGI